MKEDTQWLSWNPISAWRKLPNSAGIYEIINSASGLSYIGSAEALKRRGHYDLLSAGSSHSKEMQQAFNLDGEEPFQFRILEFCAKDKLIEREQKYMDERDFNTLYNAAPRAGTIHGYVLTDAQLEERDKARRGVPRSPEVLKSIRLKKVEREFNQKLYAILFKDFKKTDKYQSLIKELKNYADAAPNRDEPVIYETPDGEKFNAGTDLQTWWEWCGGGGWEYMDERFGFTKCDWKYVDRSTARFNKDGLKGMLNYDTQIYGLIAEAIFHREIETEINAAFEDAVKTGEVSLSLEFKDYFLKRGKFYSE